jgi:hypothetical protein
MIGFEMKANGSGGFRQSRGAATEGSIMALKVIATGGALANKDPYHATLRGVISQIEASVCVLADLTPCSVTACCYVDRTDNTV